MPKFVIMCVSSLNLYKTIERSRRGQAGEYLFLFIYSHVCNGKTHLITALSITIYTHPDWCVVVGDLNAPKFVRMMISSFRLYKTIERSRQGQAGEYISIHLFSCL